MSKNICACCGNNWRKGGIGYKNSKTLCKECLLRLMRMTNIPPPQIYRMLGEDDLSAQIVKTSEDQDNQDEQKSFPSYDDDGDAVI